MRELAFHVRAELLPDLAFTRLRLHLRGARGIGLPLQLLEVRFGLFQVELVAGPRRDQLAVLRDARAGQFQSRADFTHARRRLVDRATGAFQRFFQFPLRRGRVGELRLELVDGKPVGLRVNLEQDFAFHHQPVALLDRHFDHAAFYLRHDRDRVLVDAHVRRGRREDVEQQDQRGHPDDRDDDDDHLGLGVPRQPLQLDEDQPDEERIDRQ
ncbi:hypothetical protein D3C83_03500 [compost metagenome]